MRTLAVSGNMINRVKKMYEAANFCVKYGDNEVANVSSRTRGIFMNDIIEYI
jgi:hypothetical protein